MSKEIYVQGKRVRPDPAHSKGKGGEADIFGLGDFYGDGREICLKLYKTPDHPDYKNPDGSPNVNEQQGAIERLRTHQEKLRRFPKNLPAEIMTPIDLAVNRSGKEIFGFTLQFLAAHEVLLQYGQKNFRLNGGITNDDVTGIFRDLRAIVAGCHDRNFILGDFNDLGVLISPQKKPRIIDADAGQFDNFLCRTFTGNFVDPTLCVVGTNGGPMLHMRHTKDSDWYAFNVMLMSCLLMLTGGPYGGVYKPKDKTKRLTNPSRWQKRVTVFDSDVVYPKPSVPMSVLTDDLLDYFEKVFVKNARGDFPEKLLDMNWTVCQCGTEHARSACPVCNSIAPGKVTTVTRIQGKVKVTLLFNQPGSVILFAASQNGELSFLYHDGKQYRRETNDVVIPGPLDPKMRFRIQGKDTLFGKSGSLIIMTPGKPPVKQGVDSFVNLPVFDANANHRYWVQGGRLWRNENADYLSYDVIVGDVLNTQTLFWVGPRFGFGFYRAGELSVAFVFDAGSKGINDSVKIAIKGSLIDSTCVFSDTLCWFFYSARVGSKTINSCYVIKQDGTVAAHVQAEQGTEPWLDHIRGKCAFGNGLYVPTDDGLQRFELKNGQVELAQEYPDTDNVLNAGDSLFLGKQGLYVVSANQIKLVQMTK